MTKSKISNNFLIQGSILAVAGLLVRVIGLLYRAPLYNILGDEGMGYYGTAYDIYAILLLLSSQSMPLAVSKLVSARISLGEHLNAYKTFLGAIVYAVILGATFGLIAYFGADILASFYKSPGSARAVQVLAPTLFIVSVIGVFRGYYQGLGKAVYIAVSQILEQIVNAIVSVVAAYQLYEYGTRITAESDMVTTNASSYGAAGGTLGTCLGAFTAFIVLLFIFTGVRKNVKVDIVNENTGKNEKYSAIYRMLILTITPVLLSTTIYQIGNLLDNAIYGNIVVTFSGVAEEIKSSIWGVYSGRYKLLTTVPIAIASALSLSVVPSIVDSYTKNNLNEVKSKIDMAIRFTMIIAIPAGVGLSVLGGPLNVIVSTNTQYPELTSKLMVFSVFTVVAFSLSTISNSILQGIDKLKVPIYNSAISLGIHMILLPIMLLVFKWDIYAVVIGDFTFAMIICFLNACSIKKHVGYTQEKMDTFIKPAICSVIMGGFAYGIFKLFEFIFSNIGLGYVVSNDLAVIIAVIFAVVIYFALIIKSRTITEEQLVAMPKGNMIIRVCKKFKLL